MRIETSEKLRGEIGLFSIQALLERSLERIRFSFTPLYPTFSFQRWLAISGFPKDYDRSSTFFAKKCIRRVFCRTKIPSGHLPLNTHFFQRLLLRKPYINVSYSKGAEYRVKYILHRIRSLCSIPHLKGLVHMVGNWVLQSNIVIDQRRYRGDWPCSYRAICKSIQGLV